MSKIWNIDNALIMLKLVGGFMEVVINDLDDLKKYMYVNKDKKEIIVYDYVDNNFKQTRNMFEKRKKTYEKLGYEGVFAVTISFSQKTVAELDVQ